MHRPLRILSTALITAGIIILVEVGITLAWKEPLSAVYGSIKQGQAERSLEELERRFGSTAGLGVGGDRSRARRRTNRLPPSFEREIEIGDGIGRLMVPAIGIETVFAQGTDTSTLQAGAGHYPETALPGEGRTVAIAGHRTTYLAPFRDIDEIEEGDEIILEMPYADFVYRVEGHDVVEPSEVEIVDDVGYERLVLTACHPLYSAAQRWAVFARLSDLPPHAQARARRDPP